MHTIGINTILHTKDGRKLGNAIVTGARGRFWEVTTDYGNKVELTTEEIEKYFYVAWTDYEKDVDGYTCQEMQEMMSSDHKNRVNIK